MQQEFDGEERDENDLTDLHRSGEVIAVVPPALRAFAQRVLLVVVMEGPQRRVSVANAGPHAGLALGCGLGGAVELRPQEHRLALREGSAKWPASFGRPTTLIRRFPGTTAGTGSTVSALDVVDDVRTADSTPSSARACTAPKQVIFPAKSHKKPIKTRPKRPKGPRPALSHSQPPGTLVSILSHMPRMHVDRAERGSNYWICEPAYSTVQ